MAEQQKDQLEDLLQQMEQVSREAEDSELLVQRTGGRHPPRPAGEHGTVT